MNRIADSIEKYILKHHLMIKGGIYLVGLSGGADSVALTCLLRRLGYRIHAAHCNFQLRGSESIRDEKFCKEFANKLGIPIHIVRFDTVSYALSHKVSIEMAARDLRYDFFERTRRETGAKGICVAHHKDDQVETVLLHLVRGTGIDGLLGMKPQNGFILRPLLEVSRHELVEYLDEIGQDYIVDSSNLTDEDINPAFKEHVIRMTEHLGEAQLVIDNSFRQDKETYMIKSDSYDWNKVKSLVSPAFFLWKLLSPKGFNRSQIAEMVSNHKGTATWYSAENVVVINQNILQVLNRAEWESDLSPVLIPSSGSYVVGKRLFKFMESDISVDFIVPKAPNHVCVSRDKIGFPLTIRHVKDGDRFTPFGMKGTKLVSDYLKDVKAAPQSRRQQLVVTDSVGHIIWLVGYRIDDHYKIRKGSTAVALSIEYDESIS